LWEESQKRWICSTYSWSDVGLDGAQGSSPQAETTKKAYCDAEMGKAKDKKSSKESDLETVSGDALGRPTDAGNGGHGKEMKERSGFTIWL
jgi:hypothetical protein